LQLQRRIEKLSQRLNMLAATQSTYSPGCICFPKGACPLVGFPVLQEIAFCVKCPLHGDRFVNRPFVYVGEWMREKQHRVQTNPTSSFFRGKNPKQYIKAYLATFPSDLFPGTEEREGIAPQHYKIFLRLRDGARIQVSEDRFYGSCDRAPDPEAVRAHNMEWRWRSLRFMANLLSDRGLIIEPSFLCQRIESGAAEEESS